MRKIVLTDSQAARVRDAIRAGNPGFHVSELNGRTTASLRTKGLVTGTFPKLTEDGQDVAWQLKAHPRRRTFYVEDRTPINPRDRWRRASAPRDHVWVVSTDGVSVSYRTRTGLASAPVGNFRRMFTYDPKKERTA